MRLLKSFRLLEVWPKYSHKALFKGSLVWTPLNCSSRECLDLFVSILLMPILWMWSTRYYSQNLRLLISNRRKIGCWEYPDGWVWHGAACWPCWLLSKWRGGIFAHFVIHQSPNDKQAIHFPVKFFSGTTWLLSFRSARHLLNNSGRAGSQVTKSFFNSIHRNKLFCPPQPALSRHCWKALGGVCPQQGCCSLHRLYQVCNSLTLKAFNLINIILVGVGRLAQW